MHTLHKHVMLSVLSKRMCSPMPYIALWLVSDESVIFIHSLSLNIGECIV